MIFEVCQAGIPTRSKKIYSRKILQAQIDQLQEVIKNRGWLGVLDTPQSSIIEFQHASHLVTNLFLDNDKLMVEIEVLKTPAGKILKQLLDLSVKINFNISGVGSGCVNDQGELVVGDSFKLIQIYASDDSEVRADPFIVVFGEFFNKIFGKENEDHRRTTE